MLQIEKLGSNALELRISGTLNKSDYERFVPEAERRIEAARKIALLVHVHDIRGWTPAALWQDLKFDIKHYADVSRLAVVGQDSSDEWMATLSKPFTAAEVKYFLEPEIDQARQWVTEGAAS